MKTFSFHAMAVLVTIASLFAYTNAASAATINVTVGPGGALVFSPASVTINVGDTVKWTWGSDFHSTTSGVPGMPNGIWDSGLLNTGATFSHTFNSAGSFPYYCTAHGGCCGMVGMVTVASATPSPTPMPTSTPSSTPMPTPTPAVVDGCYPNFTTADGCDAVASLNIGAGNTALGWRSLFLNTTGSFNTGVGGGALALNNGSSNTALGVAALLLNTSGAQNTAMGTNSLVFNATGSSNTGTGYFSLMNNTSGGSNTATGWDALTANTSGSTNTAIGNQALQSNLSNSDHVAIGSMAGSGITSVDNNIIIGHHSGVHSVFGQESDRCFIDNIFGAPVSAATAAVVMIDSDGRLGTATADGHDPGGFSPKGNIRPQAIPDAARQAMLDRIIESLQTTVTQQQQQIATLTAQLKDNATQIQKAGAALEMNEPTARVVVNKP
jgi:plastocyanin